MSHLVPSEKVENLEFKWGIKRGRGGKKKDVQFYESFTYDGVDYTLYDSVYLYKEGEPEPYIGKLIKIWENPDRTKKVKVHWFFRPSEILNWLGDNKALENEIFLASGEGIGAANVNPLEAIAGKCNVVCTSKDSRNPQPSVQELEMADYIFYRTFDVEHCTISDRIGDKVAGLEVKFVFNMEENENSSGVPSSDKKEEAVAKGSVDVTDLLFAQNSLSGGKPISVDAIDSNDVAMTSGRQITLLGDNATSLKRECENDEIKMKKFSLNKVKVKEEVKFAKLSSASENRLSNKDVADGSVKSSKYWNLKRTESLNIDRNDAKSLTKSSSFPENKKKTGVTEEFMGLDKEVKSVKDSGAIEDRPFKKPRVDSSIVKYENKDTARKLDATFDENCEEDLVTTHAYGGKTKYKVASLRSDKDTKQKTNEEMDKLSNGKLLNVSARDSPGEWRKNSADEFEVTRRPDNERSKWFRALPWENRLKSACEQGTLVQLSNLDPGCTSSDVEDIIWNAFKEYCTAKMVQRTASSSPHYGHAFVIMKTKAAANMIIKELADGCLMLPNGRPLVASSAPPLNFSGKQSTYIGHLSIDKIKNQMLREMKEAVSTSHCSQPNTIEFEMALEWCLLQSRSDSWWKQLYKQQGEELRKLKANLKLK